MRNELLPLVLSRRTSKINFFFFSLDKLIIQFQAIATLTIYKLAMHSLLICLFSQLKTVKFRWILFGSSVCHWSFIVFFEMILVSFGYIRWLDTFLEYSNPIRCCKPFVIFNIFRTVFQITKTFS